jgi:hypothetical protein
MFQPIWRQSLSLARNPRQGLDGAERMMCPQFVRTTEQSHAHDLEVILKTTHSLLAYHRPYLKDGTSLRVLDLAILNVIADLQQLDTFQSDGAAAVRNGPSQCQ